VFQGSCGYDLAAFCQDGKFRMRRIKIGDRQARAR
jgi:hypothetical protein